MAHLDESEKAVSSPLPDRIDLSKSSRLREWAETRRQQPVSKGSSDLRFQKVSDESTVALNNAVNLIETTIKSIFASYPPGKQKSFFKIKYGFDSDELAKRSMRFCFERLKLSPAQIQKFDAIADLNRLGQRVDD